MTYPNTDYISQFECHSNSLNHGWWPDTSVNVIPEKLMLIVSEAAEALEEFRNGQNPSEIYYEFPEIPTEKGYYPFIPHSSEKTRYVGNAMGGGSEQIGKPCGFGIELADIIIRCRDLAEAYGINLEEAVYIKHKYNLTRPIRHGGKLA